jgi:hypothetical protein
VWTSAIASKLEVVPKIKEYIACLENACSVNVQGIMADNGTEFVNSDMTNFLRSKGIAMFTSVPYTPQQNGIAERGIRTLTEGARAMLYAAKLPKHLWSAAIQTMTYLRNRSPTRANDRVTPLERISGTKPDLSNLRIFGCPVSVAIPAQKRQKWDVKSKMGYLAGYEPYSSGYLIWFPGAKKLEKAHDVIFHEESVMPAMPILYSDEDLVVTQTAATPVPAASDKKQNVPESTRLTIRIPPRARPASTDTNPVSRLISNVPDYPQGTTRSGRMCETLQINMMVMTDEDVEIDPGVFSATSNDPTITEALNMPGDEGRAWEAARQAEWQNMLKHEVFGPPAEPPPGTKVLKTGTVCRGTYRNGELVKRKVRIVVKGYSQIPGVHFNETYAPVMKWATFPMILSIGATMNAVIRQFDVKSAYLHGVIQEEVWVQQPEGFEVPGKEHLPLRLQKALYGTKQGGHEWHFTLLRFMLDEVGWDACGYDRATYSKVWDDGTWALVGFWVDDVTAIGSKERVHELEEAIESISGYLVVVMRIGFWGQESAVMLSPPLFTFHKQTTLIVWQGSLKSMMHDRCTHHFHLASTLGKSHDLAPKLRNLRQ